MEEIFTKSPSHFTTIERSYNYVPKISSAFYIGGLHLLLRIFGFHFGVWISFGGKSQTIKYLWSGQSTAGGQRQPCLLVGRDVE